MRYLLAFFLPWICFFSLGKPLHGVISLTLQLSIIGWPIATIWAFYGVREYHQQLKAKQLAKAQSKITESTSVVDTNQDYSDEEQR